MLTITVPEFEGFNESSQSFFKVKETTLQLEHSLISLKAWEQKWHKPFLGDRKGTEKSKEEVIDYIRCMTINKNNVDPLVYYVIPMKVMEQITNYIQDPMTATWFNDNETIGMQKKKTEVVTAEIIYWWMIELGIPVEFEKWHLNTLLTLIRVISIKRDSANKKGKKMTSAERSALNARRRAMSKSRG